jgi:hypothetical protein
LGDANKHNSFPIPMALSIFGGHIVFANTGLEMDERAILSG